MKNLQDQHGATLVVTSQLEHKSTTINILPKKVPAKSMRIRHHGPPEIFHTCDGTLDGMLSLEHLKHFFATASISLSIDGHQTSMAAISAPCSFLGGDCASPAGRLLQFCGQNCSMHHDNSLMEWQFFPSMLEHGIFLMLLTGVSAIQDA